MRSLLFHQGIDDVYAVRTGLRHMPYQTSGRNFIWQSSRSGASHFAGPQLPHKRAVQENTRDPRVCIALESHGKVALRCMPVRIYSERA
jgi:hypothetical protein